MEYTNSTLVTCKRLTSHMNKGRKYTLTRITPHIIVGQWTAKQGVDYFATTERAVSPNYVIGKNGDIGLSVEEKNRAWTSSSADNDNRAITFEIASDTKPPFKITDEAWNSLVEMCVDICKRYNKCRLTWIPDKTKALAYKVADDELLITVHKWFAAKECPGDYLYNRLGELADTVTNRLNEKKETLSDAMAWAVKNGLIVGYGNGKYGENDTLTRGQLAIVLKRFYDMIQKKS